MVNDTEGLGHKSSRWRGPSLAWLIVSQIGMAALLPTWLILAGFSLTAFDTGFSVGAVTLVGAVWLLPVLDVILAVLAWIEFRAQRYGRSAILTAVPLLSIFAFVTYLLVA